MRKTAIATSVILVGAIAVFVSDMAKSGYFEFTSIRDIQKIIPNTVSSQFAKVLDGSDKDCLTKPSQTKPVTLAQIKTLRQLTDKDQAANLLGNTYCQTATGFKYLTEAGKELNLKFDNILDYDFSTPASQSLTNRDRTTDRPMLTRPPEKGMARQKE
jgi:hypothetical protein